MLHSPRSLESEPAESATGYWSIAITSTLFLIVGVGVSEAGQKSPFSLNQSAFHGSKAYSKTPSSPSIDRSRLNRSLGSVRGGGSSRFSIDRSRISTGKKKPKRRYGRRRTNRLPKAPRVVRLKKTLKKRVSKSLAAVTRTKPGRPVGVDLQATTVGPAAGLVMTLIPPTFDTRFARELSMLQHLKQAAQLSEATLDLAGLRIPKGLGLTSPRLPDGLPGDETSPFNRNGPLGSSASLGHHRQPAGVGWKGFGFLNNSHNRPVPGAAPVGVTPDSIAGAMGGVASDGEGKRQQLRHG